LVIIYGTAFEARDRDAGEEWECPTGMVAFADGSTMNLGSKYVYERFLVLS